MFKHLIIEDDDKISLTRETVKQNLSNIYIEKQRKLLTTFNFEKVETTVR